MVETTKGATQRQRQLRFQQQQQQQQQENNSHSNNSNNNSNNSEVCDAFLSRKVVTRFCLLLELLYLILCTSMIMIHLSYFVTKLKMEITEKQLILSNKYVNI